MIGERLSLICNANLTVTIDGPAGSGKTSAGKALASRLGLRFLDTGLMYRAATWVAAQTGIDVHDPDAVTMAASRMEFSVTGAENGENVIVINGKDVTGFLHSAEVDGSVSVVSAISGVREIMVDEQRRIGGEGGIVMVGRDIGTVVMPYAPLKIYLDASANTRAIRRRLDFIAQGVDLSIEDIQRSIEQRDHIDSSREDSPLKPADDALVIDTDELSLDQVVDRLIGLVQDNV